MCTAVLGLVVSAAVMNGFAAGAELEGLMLAAEAATGYHLGSIHGHCFISKCEYSMATGFGPGVRHLICAQYSVYCRVFVNNQQFQVQVKVDYDAAQ